MISTDPLAVTIFLVAVIGTAGNVFTRVIFLRSRSLRKPVNFFLIVLACTDCIILLLPGASQVKEVKSRWRAPALCTASSVVYGVGCQLSLNCIALTAVIRYIHVVRPYFIKKVASWKFCAAILLVFAAEGAILLALPATSWAKITFYESLGYCLVDFAFNWMYSATIFMTGFVIPVGAIVFSYTQILRTHLKSKRRLISDQPSAGGQNLILKKSEIRMLLQILIIFCCFCVSVGPLLLLMVVLDVHQANYTALFQYLLFLFSVNSTVNPLIYFKFNHLYRKEVLRLLACRKAGIMPSTSVETVSLHVSGRVGSERGNPGTSNTVSLSVPRSVGYHVPNKPGTSAGIAIPRD